MTPKRLAVWALAFATAVVFGADASAERLTLPVGSDTVAMTLPPGYCAFDREAHAVDRFFLEWQEKAQAGINVVVGIFAPCDALERMRLFPEEGLDEYSMLLAQMSKGTLRKASGISRREFIDMVAEAISDGVSETVPLWTMYSTVPKAS